MDSFLMVLEITSTLELILALFTLELDSPMSTYSMFVNIILGNHQITTLITLIIQSFMFGSSEVFQLNKFTFHIHLSLGNLHINSYPGNLYGSYSFSRLFTSLSNFGSQKFSICIFFLRFSISLLSSFPYNFLLHMVKLKITTRQWPRRSPTILLRFLGSLIFRELRVWQLLLPIS